MNSQAGLSTTNFTAVSAIDEVLGNRDGSTSRQKISDLAVQLLATQVFLDALNSTENFAGEFDPSTGSFPAAALKGQFWRSSGSGTIDGVSFVNSDMLIALIDNASTSVYAGEWHKAEYLSFAHDHVAEDISDATAAGRALLTAADATAQRTALELSALATADDVTVAQISDASAAGRTLLAALDAVAQRAALDLGQVDNTADAAKPLSAPQAEAVNGARDTQGVVHGFYKGDDAPSVALQGADGARFAYFDADGNFSPWLWYGFHGQGRGMDGTGFRIIGGDGSLILHVSDDGTPVHPPVFRFPADEFDNYRVSLIAADGTPITQEFDPDGDPVPHPAPPPMPVVDGGSVHILGAEQTELVALASYTVSHVESYRKDAVRGVIDMPGISARQAVVFAPGLIIPDQRPVVHAHILIGQSNAVSGSPGVYSTTSRWPDRALMPKLRDGAVSDVRFALSYDSGEQPDPFDDDRVVGFEPHVARATAVRGQTVGESLCAELVADGARYGAMYRTLCFTTTNGGVKLDSIESGTQIYENTLLAMERMADLAARRGWRLMVDALHLIHGESDAGTAGYGADLVQLQADLDADIKDRLPGGQAADVPMLMLQPSSSTSAWEGTDGLLYAHQNSANCHLVAPGYAVADYGFASDYLHYNEYGYFVLGEYLARAFRDVRWTSAGVTRPVMATALDMAGTSHVVSFDVAHPPIRINSTDVAAVADAGLVIGDSTGALTITDVSVTGADEITVTTTETYSGSGGYLEIGKTPQTSPTRTEAAIPRTNISDSADHVSLLLTASPNFAIHQTITV